MSVRSYEYRAAVVFYGGVSLAIYENGVAAAFHDACLSRGIFGPLLDLLDGKFVVDVVAGASAGGINGLMLATALERGTEFGDTANLWRESGGLDQLLRAPQQADAAPSLLAGDTYYIEQLRKAFRKLCAGGGTSADCPREIDVYITGTDLTGQVAKLLDTTGNEVDTMSHSLVFHLKHRHERAKLGVVADAATLKNLNSEQQSQLQADVLASVARVTSSFPAAFPPFTVEELRPLGDERPVPNTRSLVQAALERLADAELTLTSEETASRTGSQSDKHALIDGGVLDNKPFEPVLNAIFHRLPSENGERVDRKLFYIEPDPEHFKQTTEFTPLMVGMNAVTLPMYDSISKDLRRLDCHNARIRRFRALRTQAIREVKDRPVAPESNGWFAYRQTLQQSIGCMLLGVSPSDVDAAKRLDEVVPVLTNLTAFAGGSSGCVEWALDIAFHLRRAYHVLYCETDTKDSGLVTGHERHHVGRIIKALKLLRDVWLNEIARSTQSDAYAELVQPLFSASTNDASQALVRTVRHRLAVLQRYLDAEWLSPVRLSALEQGSEAALESEQLEALKDTAQTWLRATLGKPSTSVVLTSEPRALSWLTRQLQDIVAASNEPKALAVFEQVDACVFPGEFAAGLYELDVIEVARIAPQDTKILAPDLSGRDKLTGDALAHFSAFLRKDWRTNDIAWGHADGLCQIVSALLSPEAWQRIAASLETLQRVDPASERLRSLRESFSEQGLMAAFRDKANKGSGIQASKIPGLANQCTVVSVAFESLLARPNDESEQRRFKEALIRAGAIAAVGHYVPLIVTDTEWQNTDWRWQAGPVRHIDPSKNALDQLAGLKLGAQPFHKELPLSLVGEYVGHAGLLLWGLVSTSFKAKQLADSLTRRLGRFVKPLLWFVYALGKTSRTREPATTLVLLALGLCGVAYGLGAAFAGSVGHAMVGFGAAFTFAPILYAFVRSPLWTLVMLVLIGTLVGLFFLPPGVELRTDVGEALVAAGVWLKP